MNTTQNQRGNYELNSELKPCPFCGGTAKFLIKSFCYKGTSRGFEFGIYCTKCDIHLPRTNYRLDIQLGDFGDITTITDERQDAIEAWNRRATDERAE